MKISIVTAYPTEGAGSGTLITAQAKTYLKLGHEVNIITANNNDKFKKIEGVNYYIVPFTGEKEPIQTLKNALPFNFLMFTSHTNSTANFWNISLENLKKYCDKFKEIFAEHIKKVKPDIFHGQHCWISTSLLCDYGIPVVTTIHGTDLMGYKRTLKEIEKIDNLIKENGKNKEILEEKEKYEFYKASAEKAARMSKKIFVISHEQERLFKELFPFAKDKVTLVRNGCDINVYYNEKTQKNKVLENLNSNITIDKKLPKKYDKIVLFVGKFAQFKRVDLVLKAAKIYEEEMLKKKINVMTIIAGAGALDNELRKLQKELNLQNTHFIGKIDSDTVRHLQNISNVFVAPSDNEPDGLVYKEAMLCGNIPIGTLGGGVPDTIDPYKNKTRIKDELDIFKTDFGMLINMNNENALAKAVEYVLENEDKFDRKQIIQYALENYNQENISKNIILPCFESIRNLENKF